ncbi:Nucleoside diphosphate kinase [Acidipropionibacterium jensenii]|uniref:Nucleoside diphosphate kinase n=2 Tax=Acidipropionibacterium jensenii TaxID=1749 RepID=A0A448NX15_9ACTN|nr:Nucleoside diphosphate kinase [Acidipropionibacterium jensenii]
MVLAMSDKQRVLVLLKPDAVKRRLIGEIIGRYEARGLTVRAMELRTIDAEMAAQHYVEHIGRPYYEPLVEFITSGPLVAMVLEGRKAIPVVRAMNGKTDCAEAVPGTIRGDLGVHYRRNLVHASDSPESAAREVALWFPQLAEEPDETA